MSLTDKFPHLYECSICAKPVKVTSQGEGMEPIIKRSCECPADTTIYAPRKVTLRGKGQLNAVQEVGVKITLTIRQFLSMLTGRSI